jgi:hypothetical protein
MGMGIFKGLLQPAILRAGWSHLPERKGLVSGAIISGYGFGGFVFGMLIQKLCNPDSLQYVLDPESGKRFLPIEVGNRVPDALHYLCLVWAAQIIFGLLIITNFKKSEEQLREELGSEQTVQHYSEKMENKIAIE